ncbi:phosphoribosyl 1,2-cyclic phosphodiesterase [Rhodoferax ferrireducens]|uniref:Phosphoribosyl 1,2-cyclic phosphodiesterase n=1 Tax=Rhodoferax ferrireducens TaxID=192843 RepID=A0ABU2CAY3_9BURK|nr:hypothetical protein [Rhodoferax ferrireducens]MDR7378486.1 phosphoribosyl 1,2-cyclic phosphodiesterase [Rhodoferax ferrireducens]
MSLFRLSLDELHEPLAFGFTDDHADHMADAGSTTSALKRRLEIQEKSGSSAYSTSTSTSSYLFNSKPVYPSSNRCRA